MNHASDYLHPEYKVEYFAKYERLCKYDIHVDASGELEDAGEACIECGEGLRFPTGGICRYLGAQPITLGPTSSRFGK